MVVIDSNAHLVQRTDDSEIRVLMEKPYCQDNFPVFPGTGWDPTIGGQFGAEDWNTEVHLAAMDREGIDVSVLMPTQGLLVSQIPKAGLPTGFPRQMRDRHLAAAYCRAYNRYAANICAESPRLKAVGIVPFQDVGAAVAETRRLAKELELAGVAVSSLGLSQHLGSRQYWPIYEELQRLNLPLIVHNLSYQVPVGQRYPDSLLFQDTVGGAMETLHAFTGLMYGSVIEQFPNLRVGFFNIGVGWLPYLLERMDKDFASHGAEQAPLLKQSPSEYLKLGRWYFSTMGDEGTLAYAIECIGDEAVLFGSSYPDADSPFPLAVRNFKARANISEASKQKILCENASRFYAFP